MKVLRSIATVAALLAALLLGAGDRVRASGQAKGDRAETEAGPLDLSVVDGAARRAQIERVVLAMDRTGAPPEGVVQGGRRGVFRNAEGRLPRRPAGYWIESDVWPQKGRRGTERLVFGRRGEVYYTRDHYESFARLR